MVGWNLFLLLLFLGSAHSTGINDEQVYGLNAPFASYPVLAEES